MLIASIPYHNPIDAALQIALASEVDGIELRLDYAEHLSIQDIAALQKQCTTPLLFTLRKKSQGGYYPHDEKTRIEALMALSELKPDYMDIEHDTSQDILHRLSFNTQLICSYHNHDNTPVDLEAILSSMQHPAFFGYKIATQTNSVLDALRLLQFSLKHKKSCHSREGGNPFSPGVNLAKSEVDPRLRGDDKKEGWHDEQAQHNLTVIGMGTHGQCTRILSPVIGNFMHYACIDTESNTASGQMTIRELRETYQIKNLNLKTRIVALLGSPVSHSIGHIFHNRAISYLKENAVYIKLDVRPEELESTMTRCRTLPFLGFSVTQPLKEIIVPLLDGIDIADQPIGAINTISVENNQWIGCNTDGKGAWLALQAYCQPAHQTIVILGAGGAAAAIAHEALLHNANVMILNRTLDRAKKLAKRLGCQYDTLDTLKSLKNSYCAVINTLPRHDLLTSDDLSSNICAMDIIYQPAQTEFIRKAKKAGCVIIPGYDMYIEQALMQLQRWFNLAPSTLTQIKIRSALK